jgi:dTDP-4-dehydrorhamnose 3,5-epimerase-like enzyme
MFKLIEGNQFSDERGAVFFNNSFNAEPVKRIYCIKNNSITFLRGWQGHKIENRWFSAVSGSFVIRVVTIDNWQHPNPKLKIQEYVLNADKMDVLYVSNGNCTSIQANEPNSRLIAMSDYLLSEIQDEYRFPSDYFKN